MWCKTQAIVSLSSAEAELYGLVRASAECLGLMSVYGDLGTQVGGQVLGDASAALAVIARRGVGRIRHLDTNLLWVQEKSASGQIKYTKVDGKLNGSDLFTKALSWHDIERHVEAMGNEFVESKGKDGFNINMLGNDIGMEAAKELAGRIGMRGDVRVWRRTDLQTRTTKTTMRGGPSWDDVAGRVTLCTCTGKVLKMETSTAITRNREHALLEDAPRDITTLLIYKANHENNPNKFKSGLV